MADKIVMSVIISLVLVGVVTSFRPGYNGFPQQQWGIPHFPAFLPPLRNYQQANRLEPFLPRPSGDRNIPLTPSVMRMLGISPHGHMMNRMGMNQPYGPDRTIGGVTIDGSDISYA